MRLLIIVAVAAALQGCGGSSANPSTREIRIALTRDAITWLPVHLAQSLGYIQQEGLTLLVSDVAGMSRPPRRCSVEASRSRAAMRPWRFSSMRKVDPYDRL